MPGFLADARGRLLAGSARVATALGAVLLTAVYWLVLGPVSLTLRLFGADLLGVRGRAATAWSPVTESADPKKRLEGAG